MINEPEPEDKDEDDPNHNHEPKPAPPFDPTNVPVNSVWQWRGILRLKDAR